MDGKASNKEIKTKRLNYLETKVYRNIKRLENVTPVFSPPDRKKFFLKDVSDEEYIELTK